MVARRVVDDERQLSNAKLFARWAGEDLVAWRRAIGASVTHLSRGTGQVTDVTQEAGVISIHVRYDYGERRHPLWEFRTELTSMTFPAGLTRDDLISAVRARQLLHEPEPRSSVHRRRRAADRARR